MSVLALNLLCAGYFESKQLQSIIHSEKVQTQLTIDASTEDMALHSRLTDTSIATRS